MDNMMPRDNSGAEPPELTECPRCEGTGWRQDEGQPCKCCDGAGLIAAGVDYGPDRRALPMDNMMPGDNSGAEPAEMVECSWCDGTGRCPDGGDCPDCEGAGLVPPAQDDGPDDWSLDEDSA